MSTSVPAPEFTPQHRGADPYPRPPLVRGPHDFRTVTDKIATIVEQKPPAWWWPAFLVASMTLLGGVFAATYLITTGVGVWGSNIPVGWAFDITNFVFWIGIGHAGTLISAILFLFRQKWRTSINRFSEAMTLFAVMMAGLFPLLHLGRPWFFYWLYPIPMNFGFWPQFRSPLVWDVFAVTTYFTISLVFWYVGLIPDFASLRDRAPTRRQRFIYGIFSLGWRGSAIHWRRWEKVYLILAGISTPLVLSVHTVVSFDFAVAILPGWHATIFPPFFVAGAIFSGFAMVIVLAIPMRRWFKLEDFITDRHLDLCGRVMLATGLLVCYGYFSELWMGWYSHSIYEQYVVKSRVGLFEYPYAWSYWVLIFCNFVCIQPLWSKRVRSSKFWLFVISIIVLIGMWFERFVIVITLYRDFLPSSWGRYAPTIWDWATFIGTLGFFYFLFLLFVRFIPMISISEMREMLPHKAGGRDGHGIVEGPP